MEHRATTMSLFYGVLSFAIACASPHDKPISLSSVSTVFLQVILGVPLFLLPAGVHLKANIVHANLLFNIAHVQTSITGTHLAPHGHATNLTIVFSTE